MSRRITEDVQQERDYRRQQIIESAVQAADRIILDGSDGSVAETNYLTAMVATKMMQKALNPFSGDILKKDLGLDKLT